ncbi:hypothetical protein F5Y16DRAFT_389652 [Xylariaceae sp. FL0255]|nr:hypothetical protein F5Y16DRAFT_389652 [Xylariaceae sp. FL0255]
MPLLRRRGVMASESDMRRRTHHESEDQQQPDPYQRPDSPPVQDETPRHRRFSMLRFRNASDSQLSAKWRQHQQPEKPPPMPEPPSIITTAPTLTNITAAAAAAPLVKKNSHPRIPLRMRRSADIPREHRQDIIPRLRVSSGTKKEKTTPVNQRTDSTVSKQTVTFEEPSKANQTPAPSTSSDDQVSSSTAHGARISESSRSESGSAEHMASAQQHIGGSRFRFGRRHRRQPESLFPLSHLAPKASSTPAGDSPRPSTGQDTAAATRPAGSPATALFRPNSRNSGQSSPTRAQLGGLRGRSSTMSSLGENFLDSQQSGTTRTSTSGGRKSFGDLLGLSRMRQNTDSSRHGTLTPATPGSQNNSKNNSLQLTRESVVLPERREDDTPAKYLSRIEGLFARGMLASALSKETDPFFAAVLRSYMRTFSFFEEPMDMAIRKLLMEAELPKETQQIDRFIQAFANRYHECNPGIYATPDQAYFIAFSLLILHTDVFNKNNKHKMQKPAYLKNTRGEGIFDDVLECFYDNISYTPFIHVEDDTKSNGERAGSVRAKHKFVFPKASAEPLRLSKDPIDPYTLIIDGRLEILRPPLKDQIPLEEHYSYLGTAHRLNLKELQRTFFKTGVLQIVSARSRPDAFMTEKTQNNPEEAHPGIVDIKVTKVGLLWRKETKKQRGRSPWQEWGAILTGAQLYFFRNTTWVKNLIHQYESHVKSGQDGVPLIFKPPLEHFKPDALMSTDGAVALWDTNYKKHKNAFVYVKHGGLEEVLLAQSEDDRNDWLAKLNYAAAFRTSGVRMRGVVGGNYEGQSRRAIRRLDSTAATQLIQTPSGDVSINRGKIDHQMARDILLARRGIMKEKIEEFEEKLQVAQKHLDVQLRNARHLLILAPIQERTREQVRVGAAKMIAQLRWSRNDLWRLKCHRDVLALDLAEDRDINGTIEESRPSSALVQKDSKENNATTQQDRCSAGGFSPSKHSESTQKPNDIPPASDTSTTPQPSATAANSSDLPVPTASQANGQRQSVSSAASSSPSEEVNAPPSPQTSTFPSQPEPRVLGDGEVTEDAQERRVLEQAGLLEPETARTFDRRPSSSAYTTDETPERGKRGSLTGTDKDKMDRGKGRRSLHRTLRDGAGHLSHHRSRKGKESVSSGGFSEENAPDEILSRGTGSFTVHGKKASVITFGNQLQGITTDEQMMRHRKQMQANEEAEAVSPTHVVDDDFVSVSSHLPERTSDRRGSNTSASTATALSFRELHRKYSSSRAPRSVAGNNLVVPSDDDSDAAFSLSEGRRSPLPPLNDTDDENDDPSLRTPLQARFYTPEPPASPSRESDASSDLEEGTEGTNSHFSPSTVQEVHA